MPKSSSIRLFPLRQFAYVLLWIVFLLLQLLLFVPVDDHNHHYQHQSILSTSNSNSRTGSSGSALLVGGKEEDALSTTTRSHATKVRSLVGHNNNLLKKSTKVPRPRGDALVNNMDVYYKPFPPPPSEYRCINNNRRDDDFDFSNNNNNNNNNNASSDPILLQAANNNNNYSWMFTSCHFQNLCLDTTTQEFVLVQQDDNHNPPTPAVALALGSINPRWSGRGHTKGFHKVKWFPKIIPPTALVAQQHQYQGYYQLPEDVIMIPFHSMAAHNVGHLLWDDFYPLYTLLELFGFATSTSSREYQPWLLRWTPQQEQQQLYATCEMQKKKSRQCQENFQRFLPLLGVDPKTFSTVKKVELKTREGDANHLKSTLVCSKHAVAGIGMLSDHGLRDHGKLRLDRQDGIFTSRCRMSCVPLENQSPYFNGRCFSWIHMSQILKGWLPSNANSVPHNIGRGTIFRSFRNYMVSNMMGFPSEELSAKSTTHPTKITFSTHSSKGFERSLGFETQAAAIQRALLQQQQQRSDNPPSVQCITMKELSLPEQIQVALESAIYITVSGGGAVTATFLPPGASLIVYYLEDGGFDYWNTSYTHTTARLDWDLLNNAGHLRVHWLPMKSMNTRGDLDLLEQLVLHELQIKGLLEQD
jgi:hypothetical protein